MSDSPSMTSQPGRYGAFFSASRPRSSSLRMASDSEPMRFPKRNSSTAAASSGVNDTCTRSAMSFGRPIFAMNETIPERGYFVNQKRIDAT